jgi:hypothetical protein
MTSIHRFKKQADSMLIEVFQSLFEEIDTEKLKKEVSLLKRTSPDFDPIDHARLLTRRTALRCAATGAITGMPSGVFAVATLGADLAYLVYQQFRMILGIATIYGHEPSSKERFSEALSCLALGSGITLGRQGLAVALESAAALEGGVVAQKIGSKILYERLGKVVPVLGALSAGAISYFAVRAVGRATIRYYESLIDPVLADEIWLEGDREHA